MKITMKTLVTNSTTRTAEKMVRLRPCRCLPQLIPTHSTLVSLCSLYGHIKVQVLCFNSHRSSIFKIKSPYHARKNGESVSVCAALCSLTAITVSEIYFVLSLPHFITSFRQCRGSNHFFLSTFFYNVTVALFMMIL